MKLWTYSEIETKIKDDLAIEDEEFVKNSELMGYCNDGIDKAESIIHNLYEDYFLSYHALTLVNGTALYDMPSDIYANKIRRVIYDDGSLVYPIKRFREMGKFQDMAIYDNEALQYYRYQVINRNVTTPSVQLRLFPASREDSADRVTVWYIRNANRMESSTSICDIPEFVSFVMQYMKIKVYEKEHNELLTDARAELKEIQVEMENALRNMIPDDDTEIQPDLSSYEQSTAVDGYDDSY